MAGMGFAADSGDDPLTHCPRIYPGWFTITRWEASKMRKALEEVVSPSLIGLKAEVSGLQSSLTLFRSDVAAMEVRIMKAIESAKTEVLLRVQVADLSARNADLEAKLAEAEKERRQIALQQQSLSLAPPPIEQPASHLSK